MSAPRAQFVIITHQKRTMDVADVLYGVSMAGDGISRVAVAPGAARAKRRSRMSEGWDDAFIGFGRRA